MHDHLGLIDSFFGHLVFGIIGTGLASVVAAALKQTWNCWVFGALTIILVSLVLLCKGAFLGFLGGILALVFFACKFNNIEGSVESNRLAWQKIRR